MILKNTQRAKDAIASVKERVVSSDQPEFQNLDDLLHSIYVFEAEIFCQRQEWDKLMEVITVRLLSIALHFTICSS